MKPLKVTERELSPLSGYLALLTAVILVVLSIAGVVLTAMLSSRTGITILGLSIGAFSSIMFTLIFAIWIAVTFLFCSLKIIQPVEARVFTLFGKYYGTIKKA
ncbi:MAG: hypothetical protein LBU61_02860, partial [Coriobacteriales bacterium]|nr:hypothetical protein [Coriobacteriales bacterium]